MSFDDKILIIVAIALLCRKFRSDGQRAIERLRELERGEPPEPEPAVQPGLSPQIEAKVQAILEREELLEPEPAMKPGLSLQIATKVRAILGRGHPPECKPAAKPDCSPIWDQGPGGSQLRAGQGRRARHNHGRSRHSLYLAVSTSVPVHIR